MSREASVLRNVKRAMPCEVCNTWKGVVTTDWGRRHLCKQCRDQERQLLDMQFELWVLDSILIAGRGEK